MTDPQDRPTPAGPAGARAAELPVVRLRPHAVLAAAHGGDVLVSASVGPDGAALVLWATPDDLAALTAQTAQTGWAIFPDPRPPRPVTARVTVHAPETVAVVHLTELDVTFPELQPLPGGRILLVGARARWRPDGPDRNAVVYDSDGRPVAAHILGDGIEHVATTRDGQVWVGYFDEGVYGNFGWGGPDGPPPVGSRGLVRFSADFEPQWHYPSHVDNLWGAIDDCYALNVADDAVWTCYYTGFPLVRVREDELTGWRNDVAEGARGLVTDGSRVAFLGGHGAEDRLVVGELVGGRVRRVGEYRLALPDGGALPSRARVVGRGPVLHLLDEAGWYRLHLDDLP
ncbi:hypothetical protein [Micromonospora psammae]|uniref:hypothetical protein n=1 Tax=Micromonospora sp. CPCC 205556 TaxID=3122398 RepID=UPI002FEEDEC8